VEAKPRPMQVPPPPARPMRHRRRPGPYTRVRAALAHRRFRRRRRQRAAGRAIGLRISNLALEQATRTRCGDGQGGGRAGGALEVEETGDGGRQRRANAFERPLFAGPRRGEDCPELPAERFACAHGLGACLGRRCYDAALAACGTGGRLLGRPPEPCSPTDHTACVGVWLSHAPPVTTTSPGVATARRPSANVYVGHLYRR
jgi:hypothetical protein